MLQDGEGQRKDFFYIADGMEDGLFSQLRVEGVELAEVSFGESDAV